MRLSAPIQALLVLALALADLAATGPPAQAKHAPWGDPCFRFFFEEPRRINVKERVEQFVVGKQMNEKGYGRTDNKFQAVTPEERKVFERTFNAVRNGDLENPAGLDNWLKNDCPKMRAMDYVVRPFLDDDNRRITVIYEIPVWWWEAPRETSYERGWGLFIIGPKIGPGGSSSVAVEVTHACRNSSPDPDDWCDKGDSATHIVGAQVFELTGARYLFVNGTPRIAVDFQENDDCDDGGCPADVAHPAGLTMFRVAHQLALGEVDKVYQPHGFGPKTGARMDCGGTPCDVVVSSGDEKSPLTADTTEVAAALRSRAFNVCLFGEGANCVLTAKKNQQRQDTTAAKKSFVSVEVRTAINQDKAVGDVPPKKRDDLVAALVQALP